MTTEPASDEILVGLESAGANLARLHPRSDQKPSLIPALVDLGTIKDWLPEAATVLLQTSDGLTAAEWLMDNAYVINRAVVQIGEDLPRNLYSLLPALSTDNNWCPPRAHAIAHGIMEATNFQLTLRSITRYVAAYQQVEVLELAELWILPTMLRLACIETLVEALERLAPQLDLPFTNHQTATELIADHTTTGRDRDSPLQLGDTEQVARSVRGLAAIDTIPWSSFVEVTSIIDQILVDDPTSTYIRLDTETRNRYRKTVEDLARRSSHRELDVARRVLARTRRARPGSRAAQVGYWLIAEGRRPLERSLHYRARWTELFRRILRNHPTALYLGFLLLLTMCLAIVPVMLITPQETNRGTMAAAMVLAFLPASIPAVTIVNWLISVVLPPALLPKLDFDDGIPSKFRSFVAVPALIGSSDDIENLLHQLERHHLTNPDPNLRFALLTDFSDSAERDHMDDAALLDHARQGIARLNRRHGSAAHRPFHLLHRQRHFNPKEQCWMGWERKRGKLEEFNRLLQGDEETSFVVHEGDPAELVGIRYVITLDADTQLSQGTAARLVATLAHPLNQARVDRSRGGSWQATRSSNPESRRHR